MIAVLAQVADRPAVVLVRLRWDVQRAYVGHVHDREGLEFHGGADERSGDAESTGPQRHAAEQHRDGDFPVERDAVEQSAFLVEAQATEIR